MQTVILLTRGSPLALKQAELSAQTLRHAGFDPVIKTITTTGDRQQTWNLEQTGGNGLFTRELENALLAGEGDIAVHSAKDLPARPAPGLALAGCLPRADPRDTLIRRLPQSGAGGSPMLPAPTPPPPANVLHSAAPSQCGASVPRPDACPSANGFPSPAALPSPQLIATGSPRRRAQARVHHPLARFTELRGNVDTRLKKIAAGEADATYLAAAGLVRLGIHDWHGLHFEPLGLDTMVPAVGQGAIAWETRAADASRFAPLCDPATTTAITIERAFLARLGAGCHTAFACHWHASRLHIFHEKIGRHTLPHPTAVDGFFPVPIPSFLARLAAQSDSILRTLRLLP